MCPPPKRCRGDQVYEGYRNNCKDPTCRFFQYVDNDTKTCRTVSCLSFLSMFTPNVFLGIVNYISRFNCSNIGRG